MQDNEEQAAAAAASDPPIIIQGGSVQVDVPPGFTEQAGDKKFKNDQVHLVSLQIDDNPPIALNKNSKITITYR